MLNFEDEIKKFQPMLEVEKIEGEIAVEDMSDIMDLMKECFSKKMQPSKEMIDKELNS